MITTKNEKKREREIRRKNEKMYVCENIYMYLLVQFHLKKGVPIIIFGELCDFTKVVSLNAGEYTERFINIQTLVYILKYCP